MENTPDSDFEALEASAYRLLFERGHTAESALAALNHEGVNETLVEMAIVLAYSVRHEQALRGELDWFGWIAAVARDPGRSGLGIKLLTGLTLPVTYFAVVWSIDLFPPGRWYPQIALMAPGIALGLAFFALASVPVFFLASRKAGSGTTMRGEPPAGADG